MHFHKVNDLDLGTIDILCQFAIIAAESSLSGEIHKQPPGLSHDQVSNGKPRVGLPKFFCFASFNPSDKLDPPVISSDRLRHFSQTSFLIWISCDQLITNRLYHLHGTMWKAKGEIIFMMVFLAFVFMFSSNPGSRPYMVASITLVFLSFMDFKRFRTHVSCFHSHKRKHRILNTRPLADNSYSREL